MNQKILLLFLISSCFTALHAQDICLEVYNDQNGNGIMDETEAGMGGIHITLTAAPPSFSNIPFPMVTNASGFSCLNDLSNGEYGFIVDLPEGYAVTNQSSPVFIIEVSEEDQVNSYQIGLSTQLSAPAHQAASFSVYPNPASTSITLNTKEGDFITIYDLSARTVMSTIISENTKAIDVSSLPAGIYVASVISGKEVSAVKFVVSR